MKPRILLSVNSKRENYIIATTQDGIAIEGIKHRELPIFGVQWHSEIKREDPVNI